MVAHYTLHGRMPARKEPFGQWAHIQRTHRSTMTEERKRRLDALPWWQWNQRDDEWEAGFAGMVVFYEQHGRMPARKEPFGQWSHSRRRYRSTMPEERNRRLEALPWWRWLHVGGPVEQ